MITPPDDPIIACMMRTGYPPWMQNYRTEDDEFRDDDEYYDDEPERKEE